MRSFILISSIMLAINAWIGDVYAYNLFVHTWSAKIRVRNRSFDSNRHSVLYAVAAQEEDYSSLTVVELKDRLKQLGLPVSGVKSVLLLRLQKSIENDERTASSSSSSSSSSNRKVKSVSIEDNDDETVAVQKVEKKKATKAAAVAVAVTNDVSKVKEPVPTRRSFDLDDLESLMEEGDVILSKGRHSSSGRGSSSSSSSSSNSDDSVDVVLQDGINKIISKYDKSGGDDTDEDDEKMYKIVQELVYERYRYRSEQDYKSADAVRDRLEIDYNVKIFDRAGEWRSDDNKRSGPLNPSITSVDPVNRLPVKEIQQLVIERTLARRNKQFKQADDIRNRLVAAGVELVDKFNSWRVYDGSASGSQSPEDN